MLAAATGILEQAPKASYNSAHAYGYDLSKPDATVVLPDVLREISGLTDIDTNTIACIQDEAGTIYVHSVGEQYWKSQLEFGPEGDYEGITRVGLSMYVLRSDGMVFEIVDYTDQNSQVNVYPTGIPAKDNEGLCYDPRNNRLLIACKSKSMVVEHPKRNRVVYGFDLQTKALSEKPVYAFNLDSIMAGVQANGQSAHPGAGHAATARQLRFKPSAIAIHPETGRLFVMSAKDPILMVFNSAARPEHVEVLDPLLFNKPEGITFLENNDMIIANEGQDGKPTLLRFKLQSP